MDSVHWLTLGIGIVIGWFILPMVLGWLSMRGVTGQQK